MLHDQRRADGIDAKHLAQVLSVQLRPTALGLARCTVQKTAGHDQQAQLGALCGALRRHPGCGVSEAGFVAVIDGWLRAATQREHTVDTVLSGY